MTRRHRVDFRNNLADDGGYAPATVNKKMGHLTTMLETALKQGWIDATIRGGIRLTVPEGSDDREPYSDEDLARIFSHPGFRTGDGFDAGEPLGALRFWLPVISRLHGMISSEILQLGPDTVARHPEHDILCFVVTNAGGRRVKTVARKRWIPICRGDSRSRLLGNRRGGPREGLADTVGGGRRARCDDRRGVAIILAVLVDLLPRHHRHHRPPEGSLLLPACVQGSSDQGRRERDGAESTDGACRAGNVEALWNSAGTEAR